MHPHRRVKLAFAIGAVGVALCSSPPASAQQSPPQPGGQNGHSHEAAVAAFEQARRSIEANDCAAALPKLEESLRNEPSVGAHFSYADCFESIDPYIAFWHLRDAALIAFLRHDERHALAERRGSSLVDRIASVRVVAHLPDLEEAGFVFRIDGKAIDRFHLSSPLGVRPGDHTLSATTNDGRRWSQRINAEATKSMTIDVVLSAADGKAPPATAPAAAQAPVHEAPSADPPKSSRGSTQRTIGIVVSAVGIGTIAAGAAFGVVTIARRNDLDRACNGDANACTGSSRVINPILVSAENSATASTVLFSVGAAVLVGGIALYLLAPRGSAASSSPTTGRLNLVDRGQGGGGGGGGAVIQW